MNKNLTNEELLQIKEISRSVPFTENEIYESYLILDSFKVVEYAARLSTSYAISFMDVSRVINQTTIDFIHK